MKKTYLILLVIFSSAPEHVLSFTCDQDQTAISSPWLFSTAKTCPDLISGVPDYYNDIYRSECQRQLGLDEKPDSVPRANVEECYNLNNGTFKYRSTVCCPGTLQDTRCFTCKNISIDWDSQVGLYHTYRCNFFETVSTCPSGQVCATVYHYVHGRKVDKMCMDEQACTAATNNNSETCVSGIAEPKCTYCCENPLCNYHKSVPSNAPGPLPREPCDRYSYNCYNKSSCVEDSDASYGYRCTACRAWRYGDRCQYNGCSGSPCKQGSCSSRSVAPFYMCYCDFAWGGMNCTEAYGVCNSTDYCKNGGVCYDHEDFGLRCQCRVGFHGSQCEFEALGADRCSHPELYYKRTYTSSSNSFGNCTSRAIYFAEVTAKYTSYGRHCVSYMGQGYRAGIDGGAVTHPESMEYYRCEKGEIRLKYAYDICCPSCTRNPCQNGGWCVQKGIQHVCRCRLGFAGDQCQHNEALSVISGDPHVLSFDKRNLHPQGICKYQMAASENAAATFAVFSKFERRGTNMNVSYVKYTEVDVYEHNVRLDRHNIVYVDGEFVDPMTNPSYVDGKLKVTMNGNYVRVETDFGLSVEFDGEWTALVKVSGGLLTSGLAGNNNGDPSDDMVTKDGVDVSGMDMSQSILANSWQVHDPEDPECQKEEVPDLKECDEAMEQKISSDNGLCGLIFNPTQSNNPFANCLASPLLNGDAFAENCLFDVCALQDEVDAAKRAACGSFEALTAQCKSLGIMINWREAAQCPFNCTGGREYTPSGSACTMTCEDPLAVEQCSLPNTETCLCPAGQVFHNNRCQPHSECGCTGENGLTHKTGETWLSEDCATKMTCVACADCGNTFGDIVETDHSCPEGESCNSGICEDDSDPCWSEPCLNGGTCVTFSMNAYNCSCPEDFEGHDCEDEVWYEFGSWSNWTCIDDGMIRYRECFKYPKQVQVENELCSGESHETKDIELDCLKCLEDGGWASHECNKQIFWRCYGTVENCIAEKMNCPACTKWSQELLTCVHDDEPCVRPTTTTSRPTTTQANTAAPGDECRNDDGSIFEAVPGDPSKYKWILTDGRVFEMPCPPGTSFVLAACGCIVV